MSIFSKKKYRKCQKEEDGSISCISYIPDKTGKKITTATIKATLQPNCEVSLMDQDGNPEDIAELEEYLGSKARVKCNKESESAV